MFLDFGGGHGPSNRFFERFPTFGDLVLIELAKGFNLRHMRVLGSLGVKRYYVITKKYDKIVNFGAKNIFSRFWKYVWRLLFEVF